MDMQKQHDSNGENIGSSYRNHQGYHQTLSDVQTINFNWRQMVSTDKEGGRKLKSKRHSQKISTPPEYFLFEMDNIKSACTTLLSLLNAQGLKHGEIRRFIGDVIHVVEYGGFFTVASVNHALESLGWPKQIMNEISFKLIMEVVESIFEYQVEVHTVH